MALLLALTLALWLVNDTSKNSANDNINSTNPPADTSKAVASITPSSQPSKEEQNTLPPINSKGKSEDNSKNIIWNKISINSNLSEIYRQALESQNPKVIETAFYIAANCMSIKLGKGAQPSTQKVNNVQLMARHALEKFCASGDTNNFLEKYKKLLNEPQFLVNNMYAVQARKIGSNRESQEYFQAISIVLANPSEHQTAFDVWLTSNIHRFVPDGAPVGALDYIHEELFRRYAGSPQSDSFRSIQRCALMGDCRQNSFTSEEQAKINYLVDFIDNAIRTQDWTALREGLKPT